MLKTFRYRVKYSRCRKHFENMARSVNAVWNYCNEISAKSADRGGFWVGKRDLFGLMKGAARDLGISSQTVQAVCEEFLIRRKQVGKTGISSRGLPRLSVVGENARLERFMPKSPIEEKMFCTNIPAPLSIAPARYS